MVKLSELSNEELVQQVKKYRKVYSSLLKERVKRVDRGSAQWEELLTVDEKVQGNVRDTIVPISVSAGGNKQAESTPAPSTQKDPTTSLEIDESEIGKFQRESEEIARKNEEDHAEQIRVTQLLKLSKEQLEELQKNSKKKK